MVMRMNKRQKEMLQDLLDSKNNQIKQYKSVLDEIRDVLNNQMDYREFVDIVNAIEEILDKVKE